MPYSTLIVYFRSNKDIRLTERKGTMRNSGCIIQSFGVDTARVCCAWRMKSNFALTWRDECLVGKKRRELVGAGRLHRKKFSTVTVQKIFSRPSAVCLTSIGYMIRIALLGKLLEVGALNHALQGCILPT